MLDSTQTIQRKPHNAIHTLVMHLRSAVDVLAIIDVTLVHTFVGGDCHL